MSAPAPPKPTPKPGLVRVYRALYDYDARSDQEMSFSEGDIIYVSAAVDDKGDWLKARCGKSRGLVPSNYVVGENVEQLSNPLHDAAKRGNIEFLQECLENEVSANSLDRSGSTALYWASHGGHLDILQLLLGINNISISSQNKMGDTPLHAAAYKGHPEVIKLLLAAGANPSVRNREGQRPIDLANDADCAGLLQVAARADNENEEAYNEYDSESEEDQ